MIKNNLKTKKSGAAGQSGKMRKQKQEDLGISELSERPDLKSSQRILSFKDIVETIREPLIVLDSSRRVLYANRRFYDVFKVTARETVGNLIYVLRNRQGVIPALRALLETILPKKVVYDEQ